MSLYGMMRTGVSGMNAQANRLSTVSDNIANASTTGYKRSSTEFASLILPNVTGNYNSGGVTTSVRYANSQQGDLKYTTSGTDLAIKGDGFFVVTNGSGQPFLTRAGSFVPATRTFLSRYMLIDPLALQAEVDDLHRKGAASIWPRLSIDRRCTVVTPFHRLLNEMQELARGDNRHGSCGRGVGQAQLDSERTGMPVLKMADLADKERLRSALRLLQLVKVDQAEQLLDAHRTQGDPRDFEWIE